MVLVLVSLSPCSQETQNLSENVTSIREIKMQQNDGHIEDWTRTHRGQIKMLNDCLSLQSR